MSWKKGARFTAATLCFVIAFGLLAGVLAPAAEAKTARAAKVVSVVGDVSVKKSGGAKPYKAFKNMYLNEGDHLTTGEKSSVVLEVEDRKDEVTIGAKASLYISQLNEGEGKKTTFTMWAGDMAVRASTLLDSKDEFEIETPTSVMGVRGTQFVASYSPFLGVTDILVAAGVVRAYPNDLIGSPHIGGFSTNPIPSPPLPTLTGGEPPDPNHYIDIYPTMIGSFIPAPPEHPPGSPPISTITIVDPSDFVQNSDPSVIESLIRNKSEADRENDEFLQRQQELLQQGNGLRLPPQLDVSNQSDLERLQSNASKLAGILLKQAVENKLISEQQAGQMIQETGASINLGTQEKQLKVSEKQQKEQKEAKGKKDDNKQYKESKKEKENRLKQGKKALEEKLKKEKEAADKANDEKRKKEKEAAEKEYLKNKTLEEKEAFERNKRLNAPTPVVTSSPSSSSSSGVSQPTTALLNQSGTVNGPIIESIGQAGSLMRGPADGTLTVNGDVTLKGAGSFQITLRNIRVTGSLSVDAPNAEVILDASVSVDGSTIINDVSGNSFISYAQHGSTIDVRDSNGAKIRLEGSASSADVDITDGGPVTLEGTFMGTVRLKNGATVLTIAEGAVIGSIDVLQAGVTINNYGLVWEVKSTNGSDLTSVSAVISQINALLSTLNSAAMASDYALKTALLAAGFHQADMQVAHIMNTSRGELGFVSMQEVKSLYFLALDRIDPPGLVTEGLTSYVYVGTEITASSDEAGAIYLIEEWMKPTEGVLTVEDLDEYASMYPQYQVKKFPVAANSTVAIQTASIAPGEYYLAAADQSGALSYSSWFSIVNDISFQWGQTITPSTLHLIWTAPEYADNYHVYFKQDGSSEPYTYVTSSSPEKILNGLEPSTRYRIYVEGYEGSKLVARSTERASGFTTTNAVGTLSNFRQTAKSTTTIDLAWDSYWSAPQGIYEYRIYLNGSTSPVVGTDEFAYTLTGLADGTEYTIRVEAWDKTYNARLASATITESTLLQAAYNPAIYAGVDGQSDELVITFSSPVELIEGVDLAANLQIGRELSEDVYDYQTVTGNVYTEENQFRIVMNESLSTDYVYKLRLAPYSIALATGGIVTDTLHTDLFQANYEPAVKDAAPLTYYCELNLSSCTINLTNIVEDATNDPLTYTVISTDYSAFSLTVNSSDLIVDPIAETDGQTVLIRVRDNKGGEMEFVLTIVVWISS